MKAVVRRLGLQFGVWIIHDNQVFRLDYRGSRAECRWMARMFMKALKRHEEGT